MSRKSGGSSSRWRVLSGLVCASLVLVGSQRGHGVTQVPSREMMRPSRTGVSGSEAPTEDQVDTLPWTENFTTSLHATAQGMKTWYDRSNSGFEDFTGIPYDHLPCKDCHEPSATGGCASCHGTERPRYGAEVNASLNGVCGDCHSRQIAEATHFSDVHRELGMDCLDCHTMEDVMGDGKAYSSMLEQGAIDAACQDCHTDGVENPYHNVHQEALDCTACHVQSVVTCYNCHFETQVQLNQKVAYGQFRDFVFLMNRNGKVHAANFQTVKHGDATFVAIAPFFAHTVSKTVRECTDCHGAAAVRDYLDDGVIDVAWWNEADGTLSHRTGVVPVPPDYRTALRFDFVDLDRPGGSVWSFLESGADSIQILFGEPLTQAQMEKLGWTALWRSSPANPIR